MKEKGYAIRFYIKTKEEEQKLWDMKLDAKHGGEFSATMNGFDWYIECSPEKAKELAEKSGLKYNLLRYRSCELRSTVRTV